MVLYPRHEQHYPSKLLPRRLEEYVQPDGMSPTTDRRTAIPVTGTEVRDAIMQAQARLSLGNIDPRYFVATCHHEAGCLNEWDTEIATIACPVGYVSVGPYQIGEEEARRYGHRLEDMLDLGLASTCMVRLAEDNRRSIRATAGLAGNTPDPDHVDEAGVQWPGGAMRAYLAIAHNKGLGFVRLTVQRNQINWLAYKERNPYDNLVDHGYGDDCVTGGPTWPSAPSGLRLLFLTSPRMTGTDVSTLQADLTIHGVKAQIDGVLGPATDQAIRLFQKARGLVVDGKVGASTRMALASPP